jgi:hypothetical protein
MKEGVSAFKCSPCGRLQAASIEFGCTKCISSPLVLLNRAGQVCPLAVEEVELSVIPQGAKYETSCQTSEYNIVRGRAATVCHLCL